MSESDTTHSIVFSIGSIHSRLTTIFLPNNSSRALIFVRVSEEFAIQSTHSVLFDKLFSNKFFFLVDTATSSLSRKWCKLRQRCTSFQAMKGLDCTTTDGPSSLPYQFYDSNGLATSHEQNFLLTQHDPRFIMMNGKPKILTVIDNRCGSRNGYYCGGEVPTIIEHQAVKVCKCKSRVSTSSSSLNYEPISESQMMQHVLNQQSRLQYFDGESDIKTKPKTRRLSLFGSERKSKKETTKQFDLKQFKSVSMRCHHHHQHLMYLREQQMLHEQMAKDTMKSSKFSTVGRKKRSIYDVFFNLTKSPSSSSSPTSELGIHHPTFYVPLPSHQNGGEHITHHRTNVINPIRSIRSRSVCATDSANNVRTLFRNVEMTTTGDMTTSERRKSNSFNPRESLEITQFLMNKLRLNGSGSEKKVNSNSDGKPVNLPSTETVVSFVSVCIKIMSERLVTPT